MDLRDVGCDPREWMDFAEDRDQWRAYVTAVMNLRVPYKPISQLDYYYYCYRYCYFYCYYYYYYYYVHRCGTGGSMHDCHAAGLDSIPDRDKFSG